MNLPSSAPKIRRHPAHPMSVDAARRTILESPRQTKVASDVDVLVIGGGPAGIAAALAAARSGAKTLCVERHGMLGGVWTAGLLNPLFDAAGKGWIVQDLINRLVAAGAWMKWRFSSCFDTETMKLVLEQMFAEAGIEWWYHSLAADMIVENGLVRGAIIESKSGREAVLAKVVIDCSGDGDAAARAGAPFELGRLSDGLCQPNTLMFEIEGTGSFTMDKAACGGVLLHDLLQDAMKQLDFKGELPFGRVNYAPWIIHVPREGTAAVQATHVYGVDVTNVRDVTKATVAARAQAHMLVKLFRAVPGLENIRLTQTAAALGTREGRRICGLYQLSLDDLSVGRKFDDAITFGAFNVDIHDVKYKSTEKTAHDAPILPYEIPYRCLVPREVKNLLVAGRCISGTHEAHASYRQTGTCAGMGQAAGLAAAMASAEGVAPADLSGLEVNRELRKAGGIVIGDRDQRTIAMS